MLPQCLPLSFSSIQLMVLEEMSKMWKANNGWTHEHTMDRQQRTDNRPCIIWPGGHVIYRNGTILAILNLCVATIPHIKVRLNPTYGLGGDVFEEFQDGHNSGHLGYRNWKILAILNLYVALMPTIKFWLNLTYESGGDVEKMKS